MGVRILSGTRVNDGDIAGAVLYDSVTHVAFGPLFDDLEAAESFLGFLEHMELDARRLSPERLALWIAEWRTHRGESAVESTEDAP